MQKGQGALEYLLLIGGAVLIAVVVITLLLGIGQTGGTQTSLAAATAMCKQKAALPGAVCEGTVVSISGQGNFECHGTSYANCLATLAVCNNNFICESFLGETSLNCSDCPQSPPSGSGI